jgi:hypothetical protein
VSATAAQIDAGVRPQAKRRLRALTGEIFVTSNIFVTNGARYISSHNCKAATGAASSPVMPDNLIAGHRSAAKWAAVRGRMREPIPTARSARNIHLRRRIKDRTSRHAHC